MSRLGACIALCLLAGMVAGCAGGRLYKPDLFTAREASGWTQPLAHLGIDGSVDHLAQPRHYRVKQVSSHDRTGGGRDDAFAHEIHEGGVVLADLQGPGTILRIWAEKPSGFLFLYIDDMEHPLIARPFEDLFTGELELSAHFHLFAPPFAEALGGGHVSYVPIPYKERCRLVVMGHEGDTLGYQVTYAEFPENTPVESFSLAMSGDDVAYFRGWRDSWRDEDIRYHDRKTEKIHHSSSLIWGESNKLVFPIEGPGVITELEMVIDSFDPDFYRNIWLSIRFDGQSEPGVLAPIGHFFGTDSNHEGDHNGAVLGNVEGRMFSRYPMPFRQYAEIRIINTSPVMADFKYWITWRPGPVHDQRYFHARYNRREVVAGEPYRVADLVGEGHFAGATISARQAGLLEFLEGDDVYVVDGRPAGQYHGTGLDGYFNGGQYFTAGPYSGPLSGCTVKLAKTPTGVTGYRNHVTDAVPFHSSFTFLLEHGTGNGHAGMEYSSVAFWYQAEKEPPTWSLSEEEDVLALLKN